MSNKPTLPRLMAKADMGRRWGVKRNVVHNWEMRDKDFPKPVLVVGNGKMPLYLESDVLAYEKEKGIHIAENYTVWEGETISEASAAETE